MFTAGIALASWDGVLSGQRPVRYDFRAPVLYRSAGQVHWNEGVTANVSASGVLIVGDLPASFTEPIAVVVALPSSRGCLTGCGRIARVVDTDAPHRPGTFAIAVPWFSIERRSAALSRLPDLHLGC